jgi:hypothetical protein
MVGVTSRVGFVLVAGLVVGCATTRTGSGSAVPTTDSVKFSWIGSGNVSGSMAWPAERAVSVSCRTA